MVRGKGVKVIRSKASETIKLLRNLKLLDNKLRIKQVGDYVIIPLRSDAEITKVNNLISDVEIVDDDFELNLRGFTYKELLELGLFGKVPKEVIDDLPRSFEIIGDIAILKVKNLRVINYSNAIFKAIKAVSKNVKTVYAEVPGLEGDFRIRKLIFLGGERKSATIHKEYGISIFIEVDKVYFNVSLSEEHRRIASEVGNNEVIADLFCGVGSFSLHIASKAYSLIYSVDINPYAIECLLRSIELNKNRLRGYIIPINADVKHFLKIVQDFTFDRVIMNLPHKAIHYVRFVWSKVKLGGKLYIYTLGSNTEEVINKVNTVLINDGISNYSIINVVKVLDYAPHKYIFRVEVIKL